MNHRGIEFICVMGMPPLHNPMVPGDGGAPLADILAALPLTASIGVALPMRRRSESGETPEHDLAKGLQRKRDLLAMIKGKS
jgi:hypothetical protein